MSRRGSNEFHGSTYWTHQNDGLNANSWTNNRGGIPKAELKDNRFGGRLGGPIFRNNTFFFGNYEGRRFPQALETARVVPSDTLRQGVLRFRDAAGNKVNYDLRTSTLCGPTQNTACDPRGLGLSPAVGALWSQLPRANDPTGGDLLNTQTFRTTLARHEPTTLERSGSITTSTRSGE